MTALVWLRQDLRLADNPALWHAACHHQELILVYVFDESSAWSMGRAQRWWLHHSLEALQRQLQKKNNSLLLLKGLAQQQIFNLVKAHDIKAVYWNRCYEPSSIARDTKIKAALKTQNIEVHSYLGNLLQEPWDVMNQSKQFFKVFTPYWRAACRQLKVRELYPVPSLLTKKGLIGASLEELDLLPINPNWAKPFHELWKVGENAAHDGLENFINEILCDYALGRDIPAQQNTSRLSPHLHFGEISPWQIWHQVKSIINPSLSLQPNIERFLTELGWREFSYYLLYHFPELPDKNFKQEFDKFAWEKNDANLKAWQKGLTGYPIVDAGMRELWHTGYMHNRVRMITASFLTKDLLIHWQEGARWFWDTLLDADLASNSASWQWVAGCGVDAAPYFRIFNPTLQGEKFDPGGHYVRKWVPELAMLSQKYLHEPWSTPAAELAKGMVVLGENYPFPIVVHKVAREMALGRYKKIH